MFVATPPSVFLCDVLNTDGTPHQCEGLEDTASCAALGASCVRSSCGHREAIGIDISVSGAADPLGPGSPTDAAHVAMVLWSLVPYALPVGLAASLLYVGDSFSLSCVALFLLLVTLNEGLLKHLVAQPRPPGSCLYFTSTGMPSGHATTSIGMLTYLLLETWVERPRLPRRRKRAITAALLVVLAPVPYSRVYLHDHYPSQVAVGAAEGFCVATAWFNLMLRHVQPRLGAKIVLHGSRLGLRNTYRVDEPWLRPRRLPQQQLLAGPGDDDSAQPG